MWKYIQSRIWPQPPHVLLGSHLVGRVATYLGYSRGWGYSSMKRLTFTLTSVGVWPLIGDPSQMPSTRYWQPPEVEHRVHVYMSLKKLELHYFSLRHYQASGLLKVSSSFPSNSKDQGITTVSVKLKKFQEGFFWLDTILTNHNYLVINHSHK